MLRDNARVVNKKSQNKTFIAFLSACSGKKAARPEYIINKKQHFRFDISAFHLYLCRSKMVLVGGSGVTYKTLAQLLGVLAGLERDLGLEGALPVERDIMAVIGAFVESGHEVVRTEMIAKHPLLSGVPRSTLHRGLRALVDRGAIRHADGRKAGQYVLCENP